MEYLKKKKKKKRDFYRGISEFKRRYQHRTNSVTAKNGDLLADSHKTVNRWKNYFCQLLNVHGIN
jgi:hypothetical protein